MSRFSQPLPICLLALGVWLLVTPVNGQDTQDAVARTDTPDQPSDAALEVAGQARDRDRDGWAALPIGIYTPETHLGLGVFGVYFFRLGDEPAGNRVSSIAGLALATTREQAMVEVIPELYFDNERWHLWNKLDFRSFPDSFWGVGPGTPESAEERYSLSSYRWRSWLRRKVAASLWVGAQVDAQHVEVTERRRGGLLDQGVVPGSRGGRTVGMGGSVSWDTRDHHVSARSGSFYQASVMTWQAPLSEYSFSRLTVDLREFVPLGGTHVLALQAYAEFNAGDVPFHQMARLGGQNLMRGYFEGRYRDRDMVAAQVEYRFPIAWRFRGVAFAGIGDVADRVDRLDPSAFEVAVGTGLRFALNQDERLNLRADIGVGPGTWGLYVGVAEAF